MRKHVILLSGPPRSGKSTVENYLVGTHGFEPIRFAEPLKQAACAFLGCGEDVIESFKQMQLESGKTGRDWLIGLAEDVTKPILGADWFGVRAANEILKHPHETRFVVSDAGFLDEVKAFMKTLRQSETGHYTFWMWHIHRDGCSFDGDSRDYIFTKFNKPEIINNNGDLDDLHHEIDELLCFND
jgi:hypothetical protein